MITNTSSEQDMSLVGYPYLLISKMCLGGMMTAMFLYLVYR